MEITGRSTYSYTKQSTTEIETYKITSEPPVSGGGSGEYPPATRLVLAALMNCKISALGAFCTSREIDTEGLSISFSADFDKGKYSDLKLVVTLPASFPEKYESSVAATLATCTVERIIRNFPDVNLEVIKTEENKR